MNVNTHTPEPWGLVGEPNGYTVWNVVDDGVNPGCVGRILARVCGAAVTVEEEEANGARIVACVNACAGIDDPMELRRQRDYLMALVNELGETAVYWSEYTVPIGIVDRIRAAAKEVKP